MPASESSVSFVEVVIGAIAAGLTTLILYGFLSGGGVFSGSSAGASALEDMKGNVNDVCADRTQAGTSVNLEEYTLMRNPDKNTEILAVSIRGSVSDPEATATVDCPISNEFEISQGSYTVVKQGGEVEVNTN